MKRKLFLTICLLGFFILTSAAADGLWNPERGFRHEVLIAAEEGDAPIYRHKWPIPQFKGEGVSMVQGYCYLHKYVDKKISDEKLAALQADFDRAREEGVKYLLRFAYCNGFDQPGPTLNRILSHIEQLTPIVRKNADVIYCLQIGWIGMWGEFHTDPNGLDQDPVAVGAVVDATLKMLPANRSTMMRRMAYRDIAESKSSMVKKNIDRVGFFDDGFLANFTDAGTFLGAGTNRVATDEEDPEFAKVCEESARIPVDGECFWGGWCDNVRMNPVSALERFVKHHYTTFNFTHVHEPFDAPGAIDAWKETNFTARMLKLYGLPCDENYFRHNPSPSAYDYIRDHLGYRLEVIKSEGSLIDRAYSGRVVIRNVGTSRPINPREVYLVLYNDEGSAYEFATGIDAYSFEPWKEVTVELKGKLPKDAEGIFHAALWLPDEEESIRLRPEYAITIAEGTTPVTISGRLLNALQ